MTLPFVSVVRQAASAITGKSVARSLEKQYTRERVNEIERAKRVGALDFGSPGAEIERAKQKREEDRLRKKKEQEAKEEKTETTAKAMKEAGDKKKDKEAKQKKEHVCGKCSRSFESAHGLKVHISKAHSKDVSSEDEEELEEVPETLPEDAMSQTLPSFKGRRQTLRVCWS